MSRIYRTRRKHLLLSVLIYKVSGAFDVFKLKSVELLR